jgi:hypothetical protein
MAATTVSASDSTIPVSPVAPELGAGATSGAGGREETFLHFIAREGRLVLRWVVILSLIATAVTMITFWFWAFIPAVILMLSWGLLLMSNDLEERTHIEGEIPLDRAEAATPAVPDQSRALHLPAHDVPDAVFRRESRLGIEVAIGIGLAALVICGILMPWKLVAIGALVVFAYMIILMAPVWLGAIEDDIDEQTSRPASAEATEST